MNIILLSGGSGKRLWPLSNQVRSKQFLKVMQDVNGNSQSMLQRVYGQLGQVLPTENVTIATSAAQVEAIRSQLGYTIPIVVEPERRNTFPAIALSCADLYYNKQCLLEESVIILPIDPYVDLAYFESMHKLDKAVSQNLSDIVLMGVKPTYPSEKYGYIIPENIDSEVKRVGRFKEKPNAKVAEQLIRDGALWNCGVFCFKLGYVMNILDGYITHTTYNDVLKQYGALKKTSFDYEIVEKSKSVSVITYDGEWKDLGTWNTLTEVMEEAIIGNCIVSDSCNNTHVINELDIPVIIMGAKDMIVVASPDGILVSDKVQSSFIKDYIDNFDQRPMFEEREWGEYKVIDISLANDGKKVITKRKLIHANSIITNCTHPEHAELLTIISGRCIVTIGNSSFNGTKGDTFNVPIGTSHSFRAIEETVVLEVQI